MSQPVVLSVSPSNGTNDVILGSSIVVTFDQVINTATVNTATFSVTGPSQTQILTPQQLIVANPNISTGREYVTGTFNFTVNTNNQSVVTFLPSVPFQPNETYTVLLVGAGSILISQSIQNPGGENLASNYQWSFSVGNLNTVTPPIQAPLPPQYSYIDPNSIRITPTTSLNQGINAGYTYTITFPANIDISSFDANNILVSLSQILNDPTIPVPNNLMATITINANQLIIDIVPAY